MAKQASIADFNEDDFNSDVYRERKRLLVTIFSQPEAPCMSQKAIPLEKKMLSEKSLKPNEEIDEEIEVDLYQLYHNLFGNYFCYVRENDIKYDIKLSFAKVKEKLESLKESEQENDSYDFFLYAFLTFHSIKEGKSHIHFADGESKSLEDVLALVSEYTPKGKPIIVLIQADYLNVQYENVSLPDKLLPDTLLIMSTVPQQQTSEHGSIVTQPEHEDPDPKCSLLMQVFDEVMTGKVYRGLDMKARAAKMCQKIQEMNKGVAVYQSSLGKKLVL